MSHEPVELRSRDVAFLRGLIGNRTEEVEIERSGSLPLWWRETMILADEGDRVQIIRTPFGIFIEGIDTGDDDVT